MTVRAIATTSGRLMLMFGALLCLDGSGLFAAPAGWRRPGSTSSRSPGTYSLRRPTGARRRSIHEMVHHDPVRFSILIVFLTLSACDTRPAG